jgi:hypothetical protein
MTIPQTANPSPPTNPPTEPPIIAALLSGLPVLPDKKAEVLEEVEATARVGLVVIVWTIDNLVVILKKAEVVEDDEIAATVGVATLGTMKDGAAIMLENVDGAAVGRAALGRGAIWVAVQESDAET